MFFLPGLLSAQSVPVSTSGMVAVTSGFPPVYNGKYVLQLSDYGFFWLDTTTLTPGHAQAVSKCGVAMPPADSNFYVLGDCNSITDVTTSSTQVLIRLTSGQCRSMSRGCGGPRDDGHWLLLFGLGDWQYIGDATDPYLLAGNTFPPTGQTADSQGRTWTLTSTDTSQRNFIWQAHGGVTPTPTPTPTPAAVPPTARATATNLSSQARGDSANYYGDRWQLQDSSAPGPATRIDWDFNYKGSFQVDETGEPTSEGTVTGYFPCDPNGVAAGTLRTGANCIQSLGLTNPAASGSYQFAMQSANQYGTSPNIFTSPAFQVVCPQAGIAGYTGSTGTCAKSGGTLTVLIGGNADASASRGNLAEASVNWSFTGQHPISVQGAIVPVPSGATGFTLTITYPGGYQATAQGNIVQASLIPEFSLAPDPVLLNTPLTLINQMQQANATLDSVNSVISPGACSSSFSAFASAQQLPSSFLAIGGTAGIQAPASVGGYCVNLKYNYTPQGQPQQSQVVSNPFSTMNWAASPQIASSPGPFCMFSSCQLQAGTTYSLWDSEGITVSPHPGAQWDISGTPIGTSYDANVPISWTPTSACSSCTLRVTVNGSTATLPVTVSGSVPPTPTPTPTATPTATNTPTSTITPNNTPTPTPTPPPPTVTTNAATGVAQSSATLKGSVNPNGTATSVSFDYGTTTSYGGTTAPQSIGAGSSPVAVSQAVSGLICGMPYHFRAVATTPYATTRGLDQTFTTTACSPASFYTVTPCRIADTRNPNGPSGGPALAAGDVRDFPAAGVCGIPATAKAIAVNLAVYLPADMGDLRAHPAGGAAPMASSLNFRPGGIRSNSTIIPLGAGGQVAIQCDMASGSTNVFFDVFGYFQ